MNLYNNFLAILLLKLRIHVGCQLMRRYARISNFFRLKAEREEIRLAEMDSRMDERHDV